MAELLQYIKNIGFFLILMSVVSNALPDNTYKKYAKLFCGMVLVVLVITPFYEILNYEGDIKDIFLGKSYELQLSELEEQLIKQEEGYDNMIKDEYEKILCQELNVYVRDAGLYLVDVSVTFMENEEVFIDSMCLYVTDEEIKYTDRLENEVESKDNTKITIDKIELGWDDSISGDNNCEESEGNHNPRSLQIIRNVAKYLSLKESQVRVKYE